MGNVYGYVRVSTGRQAAEGESLEVQERHLRGYCIMQGLLAPTMLVEGGVSGSAPLAQRHERSKRLGLLRAGDVVIASKLDRMFCSALDALQAVEELKKRGVSLVLIDLGGSVGDSIVSKL